MAFDNRRILDQGIGDVFSIRVAGNVVGTKTLGSLEYAVVVSGVKLVLVLGHTRCGAVTSSVDFLSKGLDVSETTGCTHLGSIVEEIAGCVTHQECRSAEQLPPDEKANFINDIVTRNVMHTAQEILQRSSAIAAAVESGEAKVVGAVYDVVSGEIRFFDPQEPELPDADLAERQQ